MKGYHKTPPKDRVFKMPTIIPYLSAIAKLRAFGDKHEQVLA